MIRVYSPMRRQYRIGDLILEQCLDHSILQVQCGCFTASKDTNLGVLHSRKLSVYKVELEEEQKQG